MTDPFSYRDINLSTIFAKIFDKIMLQQIIKYLNINNIIPSSHMGVISNLSTLDAINELDIQLKTSRNNNSTSMYISIEQSSAFTMIQHSHLLSKLKHIGFSNNALELMKNDLNDTKNICFNGSNSSIKNIGKNSCFQGKIMATLLNLIGVLDQPFIAH